MRCFKTITPPPKKKENISVKKDYFNKVSSFKLCPKNTCIVFAYFKHFVYENAVLQHTKHKMFSILAIDQTHTPEIWNSTPPPHHICHPYFD